GVILDFKEIFPSGISIPEDLVIHSGPLDIDALVVGALRSDYQKTRIERMCQRLGINSFSPLWHKDPREHMQSLVEHGFGVVFTSVSTEGMSSDWVGRTLERESLNELIDLSESHRFNLDGEGGEFETIVVSAPHMRRDVILEGEVVWKGSRGSLEVLSCGLS
ncbi:MAG: diphthine--ammonia ligase, partial [Candidatus Thalassarchaeaceae archaeon]